ncbi:protein misato homolog 1 isoform X2 [Patella vulgata]|uniref:protein misato homolog 1 isoform X2 n=1 Tax=Patella vulgata TaxID=6465 RepID=UPI0024A82C04|nr:protein misato homolog 1 isoform X2 [Patella vulgata]
MSGREIVTLQIGHYSNFIGAHWWNLQESTFLYDAGREKGDDCVNHDILFREGITFQGAVTYTPRLVAIDLKGSLNTLNRSGGLYEDGREDEVKWSEDVTLHEAMSGPKNEYLTDLEMECEESTSKRKCDYSKENEDEDLLREAKREANDEIFGPKFYQLNDDIRVWSDYMRTYLHPKSIHIINEYMHADEQRPFSVFGMGQHVFSDPDIFEQVEDRIRFFVEGCDQLQGFHILADACDGFAGSASCFLQYLEDEFHSKSRLTFGVTPPTLPDSTALDRCNRIINHALSYEKMCEYSSLYIPLSLATSLWRKIGAPQKFPYLQYKPELHYHTGAILASAVDTMTMPYRREDNSVHITDITQSFSTLGRKLASLSSSLPYVMAEDEQTFADSLMLLGDKSPWRSLSPHIHNSVSPDVQSCVVRGIPSDRLKSRKSLLDKSSLSDILQQYLTDVYSNTQNSGCIMKESCCVSAPFPHIFTPDINRLGFLSSSPRLPKQGVEKVPVMTSLQSSSEISNLFTSLHEETSRFNIRKNHRFLDEGLDEDAFKVVLDNLQTLGSCYHNN